MPQIKEKVFKDFSLSFIAHPVTRQLNVLTNADAVKQSVKNIVLTNFYERPYKPSLGSDVISQLFENADPFTEFTLTKNIRTALANYEPRAVIDDVIVDWIPEQNQLAATIIFRVQNDSNPITIQVFIDRVR